VLCLVGDKKVFNSGGAGYILDKKALNVLATHLDSPLCYPHQRGFWEDVNVAHCLKVAGNIEPYDTRDKLDRERFNPFTPGTHLDYRIPKKEGDWYPKYNPFLKEGYDCCSPGSVSFHYCGAEVVRRLYNFFYNCNDKHKHN
jgi:glycoprotein-N-acetylgalactosamine 3-beta-galactosyltransferase